MLMQLVAAAGDITPVGPDAQVDTALFNLDPFYVEMLLGAIIPFLVSWVTDSGTAAWFKKIATLLLSGIVGLITVGLTDNGGAVFSSSAVKSAFLAFIGAVVSYVGLVRKSKVEAALQAGGVAIGPKAGP